MVYCICGKIASFNYNDEKKPLYCNNHKLHGMININKKKYLCANINCNKRANFNYINHRNAIYCYNHRLENMININSKKCEYIDCNKKPIFKYVNDKYSRFCSKHKLPDMINNDSIYNKCKNINCNKYAFYNYKNLKNPLYCNDHKLNEMINIKSYKCEFNECEKIAMYNYKNNKKGKFCYIHKLDNMIDIKHPKCKSYLCDTLANYKYKGYCCYCYINLYPDQKITRNYKTKEKYIVDRIIEKFDKSNYNWINDKIIINGYSKRRPDLLLDLDFQIIIIEIDENQHNNYDCICENKRIMQISHDLNFRSIIFIRFNPDQYIDYNNKLVKSFWKINKLGLCVIKDINECERRINILLDTLQYWINNKTDKTIEIIQLFYDNILNKTTHEGFEPSLLKGNGLAVHRNSHYANASLLC